MMPSTANIPLSLYIHLPWCVQKCPYCDFNSHALKGPSLPEEVYIAALLDDFDHTAPQIEGRPLCSIFLGGGTPSLFSPRAIGTLLDALQQRLAFASDIEITLEANPGTVDTERFLGFRAAGINRLSIGIQSLQDEKLKSLGRIHGREEALKAITGAKQAGFDNFNVDLMHGLPDQTVENALTDLKEVLATEPPHLSWYQLTLEPHTPFHHQPPTLPDEETLHQIQIEGEILLHAHGLHQYEVSAFAQNSRACLHNQNYWTFGDYLGIGAGAHSKLTGPASEPIRRRAQCRHPTDYLNVEKRRTVIFQPIPEKELAFEFMLNALRLTKGVPACSFIERTGLPLSCIAEILTEARAKNLLERDTAFLRATPLGQRFLNNLTGLFLPG